MNKSEFVSLLNTANEDVLILIYNRENENSLHQQIVELQQIASSLKVEKFVLVDYTDIRHLETFARIIQDND